MIEIKLTDGLLLLTAAELGKLLAKRPDIWRTALGRGKAITRAYQRATRTPKPVRKAESEAVEQLKRLL